MLASCSFVLLINSCMLYQVCFILVDYALHCTITCLPGNIRMESSLSELKIQIKNVLFLVQKKDSSHR